MLLRESQRAQRVPVNLFAKVVLAGRPYKVTVISLSETGCFLELPNALPIGTPFELYLPVPGGGPLKLDAKVVRAGKSQKAVDHPSVHNLVVLASGVGVQFAPPAPEDVARLSGYLELLLDR